jgi:hypothetical protein
VDTPILVSGPFLPFWILPDFCGVLPKDAEFEAGLERCGCYAKPKGVVPVSNRSLPFFGGGSALVRMAASSSAQVHRWRAQLLLVSERTKCSTVEKMSFHGRKVSSLMTRTLHDPSRKE